MGRLPAAHELEPPHVPQRAAGIVPEAGITQAPGIMAAGGIAPAGGIDPATAPRGPPTGGGAR
jgi:hypothetical protein